MIEEVIKRVNKYRKELDLPPITELPKGSRINAQNCPVAKALVQDDETGLKAATSQSGISVYRNISDGYILVDQFDNRNPISTFISYFDGGRFPEYEQS